MTSAAALLVVVLFMALLCVLGVPGRAQTILARSRQALSDMRDATLDDEEKERRAQGHAVALFVAFLLVTTLSAVARAAPLGAAWLCAQAGLLELEPVLDATVSWPVLLAATVLGVALFAWPRKRQP